MNPAKIFIGTSGWIYNHWRGPFYPQKLPAKTWLGYYATRFRTVEINNSFYKLPTENALRSWREGSPPGFIFAVKASRFITHMKKLGDPVETGRNFLSRVIPLGEKLGPILFQLPPRWHYNHERFAAFLASLPDDHRYAFEFRDETWWNDRAFDELRKKNAAFCAFELDRRRSPLMVTAEFAYMRLHGPGGAYRGGYSDESLAGYAAEIVGWAAEGKDVYCYFDNDEYGHAPRDAARMVGVVERLREQV